jgi:hypothetical protein
MRQARGFVIGRNDQMNGGRRVQADST